MHSIYFVLISGDELSSEAARSAANTELDEQGFCSHGWFAGGKADWFVIGGRWTGALSQALGLEHTKDPEHIKAEIEQYKKYREDPETPWAKMTQKVFDEKVAEHMKDVYRDTYAPLGYPDDAMVLDDKLIAALKDESEGKYYHKAEVFDSVECDEKMISDLDADDIGKWIVVVDYHM